MTESGNRSAGTSLLVNVGLPALVFIVMLVIGVYHASQGIDLTDEGMYISASMRYIFGDVPFRDEMMNVVRPFDLIAWQLFRLRPDISMLELRYAGLLLNVSSLFVFYVYIKKYASPFFAALSCFAMFLINNAYGIMSPSYNSISRDFLLFSLTLFLFSSSEKIMFRRVVLSILSGIFMYLSFVSYFPQAALLIMPVALFLISYLYPAKYSRFRLSSLFLVASFGASVLLSLYWLSMTGHIFELVGTIDKMTATNEARQLGFLVKFKNLIFDGINYIKAALIILICCFLYVKKSINTEYKIALFVISLLIMNYGNIYNEFCVPNRFTTTLTVLLIIIGITYNIFKKDFIVINSDFYLIAIWGLLSSLVYGLSSDAGITNCILGMTPVFVVVNSVFYKKIINDYYRNIAQIYLPLLLLIVIGLRFYINYNYRELPGTMLTRQFSAAKMRGVYSTPEKVESIDRVVEYLGQRVKPADYLLAYNNIPLMYFLTHTRPSYPAVWARDDWPAPLRKKLLEQMVSGGRAPQYCVRMTTIAENRWDEKYVYPEDSFLDRYVMANYVLDKVIYPFEIYRKR